jgi:beta-N-acetylhexosaminidase
MAGAGDGVRPAARRQRLLALLGCLPLVAGCSSLGGAGGAATPTGQRDQVLDSEVLSPVAESTTTTTDPGPERAEALLATLTLEEKVGQIFMPVMAGSDATTVSAPEGAANQEVFGYQTPAEIVSAYKLGGVIYLGDNIITADQVGALSAGLQAASRSTTGIDLLVAVDQEGGRVNRITDGVTVFPPASLLSGDTEAVREAGYLTGRQVALQGVNVVLAPVADVTATGTTGAIGNRSYGDDPDVVADMVRAAVVGLQEAGVAAAVKHWPGHGATEVDSHLSLPVLDITRSAWEERERVPFVAAIEEGVDIVLVGHLALPDVDPAGDPATVSPVLIDQLLRNDLGFEGVVMTDALNMGAVAGIDRGELVVEAVAAGADILLVPPDLVVAYDAVIQAVLSGRLPESRIDSAALRVLVLKHQLGLLPVS